VGLGPNQKLPAQFAGVESAAARLAALRFAPGVYFTAQNATPWILRELFLLMFTASSPMPTMTSIKRLQLAVQ
jgi:hypothetical protein